MLRIVLALFVACLAVLVAAMVYLPWWGFLLVLGGLFVVLMGVARLLAGRAAALLLSAPFRAKGEVLKGAAVVVHAVEGRADLAPEAGGRHDLYTLDVTLTPRPATGAFLFWEPGEPAVVPADARVRPPHDMPEGSTVAVVQVVRDGRFGPDEEMKYFGRQRLRLSADVPRGWGREVAFLDYFSKFGTVTLPPPAREKAGDGTGLGRRESTRS